MASQRPQRHLKTFLEPVAPSSLNMSPYRATATPFVPNIITFMSSWQPRFRRPAHFQYTSISPSTVLRILGTHLELFATPWYIDIFRKKKLSKQIGELVDPQIGKYIQKPDFRVAHFFFRRHCIRLSSSVLGDCLTKVRACTQFIIL